MTIPVTETLSTSIQSYGYGAISKYILGVSLWVGLFALSFYILAFESLRLLCKKDATAIPYAIFNF